MSQGYARFIEVLGENEAVEGVIGVEIDGYTRIHQAWLKQLLTEAGYEYGEIA